MPDAPDSAPPPQAEASGDEPPPPAPAAEAAAEEVEEYESDPDDAPLPAMRRREASDDEGSEGGRQQRPPPPRARIGSDHEDDGQGAAEVYEDEGDEEDEFYDEEEELGEELEAEYEEAADVAGGDRGERPREVADGERSRGEAAGEAVVEGEKVADGVGGGDGEGEEKKENEPYAVPTAGAFYMHDDRFQENGRGRRRRMFGGRKLWDAKDEHAWVHDRFEEMNLQDERYEDKRMSRGRFRGRGSGGKTRGAGRGFSSGGKYRSYHNDGNNQNRPQKVLRGRGPRRYESLAKNNRDVGSQYKQPARSREPTSSASTVREAGQISNAQPEAAPPKKNNLGSSLNYASPPFYPSGASTQDFSVAPRKDMQAGNSSKVQSSMKMDDNLKLQSGSMSRGRNVTDSGGRDKLYDDGSFRSSSGKTSPLNSSDFMMSSINPSQSPGVRVHGGNSNIGVASNNQPTSSLHQVSRVSTQQRGHTSVMHQKPVQSPTQSATRMSSQQLGQRPGNQLSPPPQHLSIKPTEGGENGSYPSSNKSKTSSTGTGKTSSQDTGMSSFVYNGAQVIGATGAVGLSQGEQNFPGTPAFLPVMQFGGQHPGGLGVPAVGMALPGYVAQQQLGLGNNEMAWLPLLAGAAGAFGTSYPPYIALDSSFYSRSSGQTSSSTSSREPTTSKGDTSPPRNDVVNEEIDQRQNKPRRYSEMNFGQ